MDEPARRAPAAVYDVHAFNRFEACRFGMEGTMVDVASGRRLRIGEDVLDSLAGLMPVAARLGCVEALRELADGVRRGASDAAWLRARRAGLGSLPDMVRASCVEWARL